MSSWFIFNSMGFYPVNPASATYIVSAPLYERVEVTFPQQPDHTLVITAAGAKTKMYVERLTMDNVDVVAPVISHADLLRAKELTFTMNEAPQSWFKNQL